MNRFNRKMKHPFRAFPTARWAMAAILLVSGCRSVASPRPPDLDRLYSRGAQTHGPEHNPVIVIPGLTGSKLVEARAHGNANFLRARAAFDLVRDRGVPHS